jgi:hypothetical protein
MSSSHIANNAVPVYTDPLERATLYISIILPCVQTKSRRIHVALRLHCTLLAGERKSLV